MEKIKLIPSFKNEELMKNFFSERTEIQKIFNEKVNDLKKEAVEILKGRNEKVLYSIPMVSDTYVQLSVDAMNNFYRRLEHLYSTETGLLLKEIQIVNCEYTTEEFKLSTSCRIKFIFSQKEFNNHWASFSFNRLSFEDNELILVNNSMGACLDPRFIDPEKYFLVKNFLIEARDILSKIEKENEEK